MDIERVSLEPRTVVGIHEHVSAKSFADFFGRAFSETAEQLGKEGATPAGPAIAVYRGKVTDVADVTAGFPVSPGTVPGGPLETVTLPGGPAVAATHVGPYDTLGQTYETIATWMEQQHLTPAETMWEEYLTGPETSADPSNWNTRIVFPLA